MLQKIIGTSVPLTALWSDKQTEEDQGTFAAGIIFLDWLKKTNQSAWQLLPLHETQLEPGSSYKHVSSPYKGYGIGLDLKYLPSQFAHIAPTEQEKNEFMQKHEDWIMDYALFCALRDHFQTDDWRIWDADIRSRKQKALGYWKNKLKEKIDYYLSTQWKVHEAYKELRQKAKACHISLVGDVPFYISVQSPLVWAHQIVFHIQKDGTFPFVSGIPNTASAHFGRQVWGHPLYNWDAKNQWDTILSFWKIRLRYITTLFDTVRLDHAKAFFEYGVIDPAHELHDTYKKGPGAKVFEELIRYSHQQNLSLFAEDSGENVSKLRASLQKLDICGMKIFRFALDEKKGKINSNYGDTRSYPQNTVAYTTTHDTETLLGYLIRLTKPQKQILASVSKTSYASGNKKFAKKLRDKIISSPAHTIIIPIQDWLLITDRINIPGTETRTNDPNWQFRIPVAIEKLPADL